jgi:hypothetical protein
MKKIFFFLMVFSLLYSFEVVFTKVYKKYIVPNQPAILIKTKAENLSFPFQYIKTKNGYILIGDINQINLWLENDFYAPSDATFKTIKIAKVDMDKIQEEIIEKVKNTYKKCTIKSLIFLTPDEERIITKPTYIEEKYKIILDCK